MEGTTENKEVMDKAKEILSEIVEKDKKMTFDDFKTFIKRCVDEGVIPNLAEELGDD